MLSEYCTIGDESTEFNITAGVRRDPLRGRSVKKERRVVNLSSIWCLSWFENPASQPLPEYDGFALRKFLMEIFVNIATFLH